MKNGIKVKKDEENCESEAFQQASNEYIECMFPEDSMEEVVKLFEGLAKNNKTKYLFNNRAIIDRNKVKLAVFNRIDFPLSSKIYKEIDKAFEQCWNKEIGLGGDIYEGFIEKFIFETLVNKKILIEYSRIEKVVEIMMDYIEMTNGFLDENRNLESPSFATRGL